MAEAIKLAFDTAPLADLGKRFRTLAAGMSDTGPLIDRIGAAGGDPIEDADAAARITRIVDDYVRDLLEGLAR